MTRIQRSRMVLAGFLLASLAFLGCNRQPPRLHAPEVDASAAASAALGQYDANQDGIIAGDELAQAPELRCAMDKLDTNSDGGISADEISARIGQWQESKLGRTSMTVRVLYRGHPLEGATVTLEPAAFLGDNLKAATGTTDASGTALPSIPTDPNDMDDPPGVPPGFYRVKISKQAGGQEMVPPAYNQQTQHGLEVALDSEALIEGFSLSIQ